MTLREITILTDVGTWATYNNFEDLKEDYVMLNKKELNSKVILLMDGNRVSDINNLQDVFDYFANKE